MAAIIIVILSFILTAKIGKIVFRNTIATGTTYGGGYIAIWAIVMTVLSCIARSIGVI